MTGIRHCNRCSLFKNQPPLMDDKCSADIMWVGLSAKKVSNVNDDIPLSRDTNSGRILHQIEEALSSLQFYKTNIVKCLPLDEKNKLRYPSIDEMRNCYDNFCCEVNTVNPKMIFLLGERVSKFVLGYNKLAVPDLDNKYDYSFHRYDNKYYIPVHHPSFISVYRRREVNEYAGKIQSIINNLIKA